MKKPLITFALICFNQETFIRQAIEGAFSQTYSPLEIIISDDFSTDRTYQIVCKEALKYHGPHNVRVNRNRRNLGIGAHVNRAMELANGELLVAAAGDDVSLPNRVKMIHEAYQFSKSNAMSIYSSMTAIDKNNQRLGLIKDSSVTKNRRVDWISRSIQKGVFGASHAWHRKTFEVFGPLMENIVYEDRAITFRSALLGQIIYIDEPLVLYRKHHSSVTNHGHISPSQWRNYVLKVLCNRNYVYTNMLSDLSKLNDSFFMCTTRKQQIELSLLQTQQLLLHHMSIIKLSIPQQFLSIIRLCNHNVQILPLIKCLIQYYYPFYSIFYLLAKLLRRN